MHAQDGQVCRLSPPLVFYSLRCIFLFAARSLKKNQTICIRILKNLQTSTRILQSACVHAKTNRDPSMVTRVPKLKSTLEAFLFRVKEALEMNGMEKVTKMEIMSLSLQP